MYQAPHGYCGLSAVTGCQEQFLQLLLILYSQGEASVLGSSPLMVKNENDFAVYCIVLLEFLVFCGTHIVGYPEVCSATLMNM